MTRADKNRGIFWDVGLCLSFIFLSFAFFIRLFYPTLSIFATAEIGANDIWYSYFPTKVLMSQALQAHQLPTWTNLIGGGFPLLADGQMGFFYLPNLLLFSLFSEIVAFNLSYVLSFFLCAFGTYLYGRGQKWPHMVSWFAALVYAFSGFFVTHISHLSLLQGAGLFPLLLYFADRLLRRQSQFGFVFFMVTLSQQIFIGFPQAVFISLVALVCYACLLWLWKETHIRQLLIFLLAIACGVMLSAAQILPTLELTSLSQRASGVSTQEIVWYKFPPVHFASFFDPFIFGNPQIGTYPHFNAFNGSLFWENTGYVGILPLLLFLVAALGIWRNAQIQRFGVIFVLFGLLMVGGGGPLYVILTLPPFSFFRFSSRYLFVFVFALVSLASVGLVQVSSWARRRLPLPSVIINAVCLLSGGSVFGFWYFYHTTVPYEVFNRPPEIVEAVKRDASVGRVYPYLHSVRSYDEFFQSGSTRADRYLDLRNELPPNTNYLWNLPLATSYASLYPKRLGYFSSLFDSPFQRATQSARLTDTVMKLLDIRNATHVVSPVLLDNKQLEQVTRVSLPSYENTELVYLYRNSGVLPRYYLIDSFVVADTVAQVFGWFEKPEFDERKSVVLEKPRDAMDEIIALDGTVRIIYEEDARVFLEVVANKEAILAISQNYYPGWEAYVDGKKTELFPTNLVNMGMVVPKGPHRVELVFRSKSIRVGLVVTSISYLLFGLYCVVWALRCRCIFSR